MLKSMMLRQGVGDVQGGDSSEIEELKAYLADLEEQLNEKVKTIEQLTIELGDRVASCEQAAKVLEKVEDTRRKQFDGLSQLFGALQRKGTAAG
jgi:septal ring factor EnvC (AmiA/AmiB activator)